MDIFKAKKVNTDGLKAFGFKKVKDKYIYCTDIYNGEFCLKVIIAQSNVTTELREKDTGELYTLHLVEGADGSFVGKIKEEYQQILDKISVECFEPDVFEWEYSKKILEYAYEKYGTKAEYLWEKFPRNAVCRRADNKKWYFAVLSVKGCKLGFETDEIFEVIDLRASKDIVPELIKQPNIYPAYHMNKKSWITITLDGSMKLSEIKKYIDESYNLAK